MKVIKQATILIMICLASDTVCNVLPFKVPSSVISIILLFFLLLSGILKESQIKETTGVLMGEMSLFFIPMGVGTFYKLLELHSAALKLLAILSTSLAAAFIVTYYVVYFSIRVMEGKK